MVGGSREARRRRRRERGGSERGVALVEFALIAPLLFLLLFGIIEFGWAFYQLLDVRHGARETARLAAVNYRTTDGSTGETQVAEILTAGCDRMDSGDDVFIVLTKDGDTVNDTITVEVTRELDQLTGFLNVFLDDIVLDSDVDIRVEQAVTWDAPGNPPNGTAGDPWDCTP